MGGDVGYPWLSSQSTIPRAASVANPCPCHVVPMTQATSAEDRPLAAMEMLACIVPTATWSRFARTIQLSQISLGSLGPATKRR